ncbi:phage terminase large subunit [Riemerella anatipestifer]|uniref:phage terminase large subunit n=1 Tax=Riemerella anatipestifer TaxID=34085 RepID=UPI002265EA6D|nr:phage terminase large subunit [Riemerella anatipestifer]UZX27747.1 phage terminase large subunit [Riemerella anatipestifer]
MKLNRLMEKLLREYDEHAKSIEQSTGQGINPNESPAERRKKRLEWEKDYIVWFEEMFPHYAKVKCAWFHKKLANIIINNDVCEVLAEIYRSGAKSVHICMGIPLYLYVTGKLRFMLLVGQTDLKAKKLISDIQKELVHNRKFIHYYGKKFKFGDWADGDFTTTDGVKFMTSTPEKSPRGLREGNERPDYIVVDDVDTKQRVNNDERSVKLLDWAMEDLKGTFDEGSPYRRFIVANNNFHKNTLINQLKVHYKIITEKLKAAGIKSHHFILTVPAVKDLTTFEPNWPEKTSAAYWKEKFIGSIYRHFMREYMHVHIVEGSIFKNEWIHYKPRLQYRKYDALCFYGDLSYKETGDFKAMVFVGKNGREFHVLDAFVRQTSKHNVAVWLYDKVEDDKLSNYNIQYFIEGNFAQDEFVNDFDLEGEDRGWIIIPVVPDKKSKEGKFDRIESMQGFFIRKNIYFNKALEHSPDIQELINQLLAFQKGSGAHDDAPDALQSAIAKLNRPDNAKSIAKSRTTSRKEMISKQKNRF